MVYVAGVAGEDELVGVVFGGEDAGHVFVGDDPVVHVVAHEVGVVEVAVAYFKPKAERLARGVGDEGGWKPQAPCGVAGFQGHCWLT